MLQQIIIITQSFVASFYLLITNGMPLYVVSQLSQETRSKFSQTSSSTCKMQNDMCCIKKQSALGEVERAHEYILFCSTQGACTQLFKTKTQSIVIYATLFFLIPRSYVNNLSCNRPDESKTNGTAFGKLLASENLLRLLLLFQERCDEQYFLFINVQYETTARDIRYDS